MSASEVPGFGRVRSFVRRGSRLGERHGRAWDDHGASYLLPVTRPPGETTGVVPGEPLDIPSLFGMTPARVVVEVGSGQGESLIHAAQAHPDWALLGFEVWRPGLAQTVAGAVHAGASNIRLLEVDAAQGLPALLAEASVDEVWTFFPDPWPKARHVKRRLVSAGFAAEVARIVRPGGVWRIATDWAEYADMAREVLRTAPGWALSDGKARFDGRPVTRFERRGLAAGRAVHDLSAIRI